MYPLVPDTCLPEFLPVDYEVGESSQLGTTLQVGPTTTRADLKNLLTWLRGAAPDAGFTGSRPEEIDGDFRAAESRLSEKTVSGGTKDSEEPQDSDDRASDTAGTC
ncbi:hypothetical protein Tco_1430338 [Tanacetum coccineum]